jgi:hypothetical protein
MEHESNSNDNDHHSRKTSVLGSHLPADNTLPSYALQKALIPSTSFSIKDKMERVQAIQWNEHI